MANVRITMRQAEITGFLHDPAGPVHRAVASRVRKTEAIAVATVPVDNGRLKGRRTSGVRDEGNRLVGYVSFNVFYALYVHEGTGLYGPRRRVITPKKAKALVFRGPDGNLVRVKSVKGMRPRPFLVDALVIGAAPWPVNKRPLG